MTLTSEQLLRQCWGWLLHFQAAARTESISSAAKLLCVDPSSVSRCISKLEAVVGVELFHRQGNTIRITPAGETLAQSLHHAAGELESALATLSTNSASGKIRVITVGQLGRVLVLPAVLEMREQRPQLDAVIETRSPDAGQRALLQGDADLFVALNLLPDPHFDHHEFGLLPLGIYIGRGHPMWDDPLSIEALLEHEFVAQAPVSGMKPIWPANVRRKIGLEIVDHSVAMEAMLAGRFVGLVPEVVAREQVASDRLRGVAADIVDAPTLSACCRRGEMEMKPIALLLEAIASVYRQQALSEKSP